MTPECEATMSEKTHCLGLTIFHNKAILLKGTVLRSGAYASHLIADGHLK